MVSFDKQSEVVGFSKEDTPSQIENSYVMMERTIKRKRKEEKKKK